MIHLTQSQIYELVASILTIIITVFLLLWLRRIANIPVSNIGPELNLLTYGYLWDTVLDAIKGDYWHHFPEEYVYLKPLLLGFIIVLNFVMTGTNLILAYKLENGLIHHNVNSTKFAVYFMGIVSLCIYIVMRVFLK